MAKPKRLAEQETATALPKLERAVVPTSKKRIKRGNNQRIRNSRSA
jgi:hypothetical protein